ncbi:hypothetical protein ScPMuIL_002521 [Solemya velum]
MIVRLVATPTVVSVLGRCRLGPNRRPVLVVVWVTTAAAGPRCYECRDVDDRRKCNKVQTCADDELCFTEKHLKGGRLLYSMACKKQSFCEEQPGEIVWTKERLEEVMVATGDDMPLCRECCADDMCNDNACDHISENIVCADHTLCKHAADEGILECNHTEIFQYCMESCGGCHQAGLVQEPRIPTGKPKMAAFQMDGDELDTDAGVDLPICGLFTAFYNSISGRKREAPPPSPLFGLIKGWASMAHQAQTNSGSADKPWNKWKSGKWGYSNWWNGGSKKWGWGSTWGALSGSEEASKAIVDSASAENNAQAQQTPGTPSSKLGQFFKIVVDSIVQHIALSDPVDMAELAASFSDSVAEGVQELAVTVEIWYDSQYCGDWMSVICPSTCYYER